MISPEPAAKLGPHTSLRVGGPADYFILATSGRELAEALAWARDRGIPARVVGGGSNLLVADAGVEGLVIKAADTRFDVSDVKGEPTVLAASGANLANLARRMAKMGLRGLEWAANVPGTVGGAVVNNAGAFGGDTASSLKQATVIDAAGRQTRFRSDELDYAYRTSRLKRKEIEEGAVALEVAEFHLHMSTPGEADALVKQFNAQRMRTQPRSLSAGSVFANPEGSFSGKLIEEAGLKRTRIGGAEISDQHANFIVNIGGATARHVYALMRHAQDVVYERTGIWLRPEIELLGRWTASEIAALERDRAALGPNRHV